MEEVEGPTLTKLKTKISFDTLQKHFGPRLDDKVFCSEMQGFLYDAQIGIYEGPEELAPPASAKPSATVDADETVSLYNFAALSYP